MAESGDVCDLSAIQGKIVDKHSTGGVGDKCTAVIMPLVACFGVPIAKLSGRGLGHTGGTIDKFNAIEGLSTEIDISEFARRIQEVRMVLSGQTPQLAPADKILYALRDVTATVDSIPLIASSIMSKKIAGGADGIVLNVTYGDGAFMKNKEDAESLADAMIKVGHLAKKDVTCVLSPMDQPLGFSIGNALEIEEVIETLKGNGPKDLVDISVALSTQMVLLSDQAQALTEQEIKVRCMQYMNDGTALVRFIQFVRAQGGRIEDDGQCVFKDARQLFAEVKSSQDGYIHSMPASALGHVSVELGAGRKVQDDQIDYAAGIVLHKKVGDMVKRNEVIYSLFVGEQSKLSQNVVQKLVSELDQCTIVKKNAPVRPDESVLIRK